MAARGSIPDFSIANELYALSEVSVHVANPDGSKGALATLYAGPTGADALPNPQTLDPQGKWEQPVYIEDDVILDIDNPDSDLDGETGIVAFGGRWRSYWTGPGTRYNRGDRILGPIGTPEESNVYLSNQVFSSGGTWAGDLATPGLFELELDYQALRALAMAAVPLASETVAGRIEIASQAEANAGLSNALAITPLRLVSMQATETQKGVAEVATQAETNAGSNDTTIVTPAKLHARVASTTLQGLIAIATQSEVDAGTVATEAVVPTTLWATPMRSVDRNVLGANCNFSVAQRGAGGAASFAVAASTTAYTLDRWYLTTGANQASVVAQRNDGVGFNRFAVRIQRNAGQTGTAGFFFGFPFDTDEVANMRGKILSLRFKARAGADWSPASGALAYGFRVGTGAPAKRSAGAFTGETTLINSSVNLTLGGAVIDHTFTGTIAVPADATNGEFFLFPTPVGTAGANDWVEVSDIVLEEGPAAAPRLFPVFEDQLRACQRHFFKTFPYGTAPAQNNGLAMIRWRGVGTGAVGSSPTHMALPVAMRNNSAVITTYNPAAANAEVRNTTDGADCSATAAAMVAETGYRIAYTGNAGAAVNDQFDVGVSIDNGI